MRDGWGELKNRHQAVSQGDYGLEAWRLDARRLKKAEKVFLQASQPSIF